MLRNLYLHTIPFYHLRMCQHTTCNSFTHACAHSMLLLLLLLLAGEGDPVAVDRDPGGEADNNRR
jgi:hypothetical protein